MLVSVSVWSMREEASDPMSDKALTRFDLDAYGARVYRDSGKFVQADDAAHEIKRLEARLEETERELLLKEGDNRSARSEQSRLQARVLEVEIVRDQLSQALSVRDHQYKVIEQERDRLQTTLHQTEMSLGEQKAVADRLHGLIGALPKLEPFQVAGLCSDLQRYWGKQTTDPLAALLREKTI